MSPPTDWPKCFQENATLKRLLGKKGLAGKRCRLTALPSNEDKSKYAAVDICPEDPFGNAEKVHQVCGWEVIKGYAVYELRGAEGTFVAHKRWWNQKESGVWVDPTPRLDGAHDMVLLESSAATKDKVKMSDAVRAAAKARFALGGLVVDSSEPAPAARKTGATAAPTSSSAKKVEPPPIPPKLEFTGSESLEEMLALLTKGTAQAQARAAAAIASQAATSPVESKRIIVAGGLQPLVLLLRHEGEVRDHAARAIMSLADCMEHQQMITQAGTIPAVVGLLKTAPPAVQDTAAGILGNLAIQSPSNQSAIVAAGALPSLVTLLLKGSTPAKEQACFAIWNLACQHPENQVAIEQAGAIKPLVALLSKGSADLQEEAAGALMNLAAHPDNKRVIAAADAIKPLVEMVKSGGGPAEQGAGCLMNLASNNSENQLSIQKASALLPLLGLLREKVNATRRAREYVAGALMNLTLKQPSMQAEVVKAGAIPLLVEMLNEKEGQMEEVAGALTNLADTSRDNQLEIAKAGAIKPLVKLIGNGASASCQEEAAGTLMNLAACDENKAKIVTAGAVAPLVALLGSEKSTDAAKEHVAGALANLACGHDEIQSSIVKAGAIHPLLSLLTDTTSVAARAASALLLLSRGKDHSDEIVKAGGVGKIVKALKQGVQEAAGALTNLALHSSDTQDEIVREALPKLVELLSAGTPTGQEEAAGVIMNLLSGAPHHQKTVATAGAIFPLVMMLSFGSTPTAKGHAAAALANLAVKNDEMRKQIVSAQACPALLEMLKAGKVDAKGAKKMDSVGQQMGDARIEAANCLRVLMAGDTQLQAVAVNDGLLTSAAALLKDKDAEEAANRLLGTLDACFADMIAQAKK